MIDAALLERIHADLDGELDAASRASLMRDLEAQPEALALHHEWSALRRMLESIPLEMPPAELRAKVRAQIEAGFTAPVSRVPRRDRRRVVWAAWIAVAASVGALIVGVVSWRGVPSVSGDALVGTMVASPAHIVRLGSAALPASVGVGRISLLRLDGGHALALEVPESVSSLLIEVRHGDRVVALGPLETLPGIDGRVRRLAADAASGSAWGLTFRRSGEVLGSVELVSEAVD